MEYVAAGGLPADLHHIQANRTTSLRVFWKIGLTDLEKKTFD